MLVLTIRTDKPESEIGLFNGGEQLVYITWEAHRRLAETLHTKILEALKSQNREVSNIQGIIIYKGPGSFTGLRIGISVANALAYSLNVPIVGVTSEQWIKSGYGELLLGTADKIALPEYGAPIHITTQKK